MNSLTMFFALLMYGAALVLTVGVAWRVYIYARTPAPLKIPTTPAPTTRSGVWLRMFREVVFFESLFKSNKWIWLFGYIFHVSLLLVLVRHLRYFSDPVWAWVALAQTFGTYAGLSMLAGLFVLWLRRIVVERVRYISNPSDHLMLWLLMAIALSGLMMRFVEHTDIIGLKAFTLGLVTFHLQPIPADPLVLAHLSLVSMLMLVFPISKLLHAPGVFFSPTRNQVDNPREKRHLSAWAAKLESK